DAAGDAAERDSREYVLRRRRIRCDRGDGEVAQAVARSRKCFAVVVRDVHAVAFNTQDDALRTLGVEGNRVDDQVFVGDAIPELAGIVGAIETADGSRK